MIRVGKYDYKSQTEARTDGYTSILIHTTGPLSPYTMKDCSGVIMENYWQFSKIWENVTVQKQPLSKYNPEITRWEHPSEVHWDTKNNRPTSEYWKWREKGMNHKRWVRYPNGFHNHKNALGSIIGTETNWRLVDYITARKEIYFPKYREITVTTFMYSDLLSRLSNGENIQINEVDGPVYISDSYPYNKTKNGSLKITEKRLAALIENPIRAFGHGYCLAGILLGIKKFE